MSAEYTPTLTQPTGSSTFTATIPELTDSANIITALGAYHNNISWYLSDRVSRTSGTLQTVTGPITFSGSTITLSGASITISGTTLSITSAMSVQGAATFIGSLTAQNGIKGDVLASNNTIVLDNGTGGSQSASGAVITGYDATFSGTAAAARTSTLYKDSAGGDYTTITGTRRIFVGQTQPTLPGLQAGDIWMW